MIYIIYNTIRNYITLHREKIMASASASSSTTTTTTTTDYEYPALCIPRALGEITHEELYAIIKKSGLGEISKIVMRPKEFVLPKWERTNSSESHQNNRSAASTETDNTNPQTVSYNNIYIYFKRWNTDNPQVRRYRDNVINGQTIKLVHKTIPSPIFWRCVAAKFKTYTEPKQIK